MPDRTLTDNYITLRLKFKISKLAMAPGTYFLETAFFGRQISRTALVSIFLVLMGVGTAYAPSCTSFYSIVPD